MERTAASTSSTEAGVGPPAVRVLAGWIAGAQGLRGQVRIHCAGDDVESLLEIEQVYLGAGGEPAGRRKVREARPGRRGEVCMDLLGIGDRAAAEALRGTEVWIDTDELGDPPEGEYRVYQLTGCEVEDGEGRKLGRVREVRGTGAHDVLVVAGPDGAEHLIPAVQAWWREVDLTRRRIVVELPPGLLEP
jgi:16S rRNA processing protein RimM